MTRLISGPIVIDTLLLIYVIFYLGLETRIYSGSIFVRLYQLYIYYIILRIVIRFY